MRTFKLARYKFTFPDGVNEGEIEIPEDQRHFTVFSQVPGEIELVFIHPQATEGEVEQAREMQAEQRAALDALSGMAEDDEDTELPMVGDE